jgi:hypothetical protein
MDLAHADGVRQAFEMADCPDVFPAVAAVDGEILVGTVETFWEGQCPVAALHVYRRFAGGATGVEIRSALTAARRARVRTLRRCSGCGQVTPPEHGGVHDDVFECHGCQQRRGVVF